MVVSNVDAMQAFDRDLFHFVGDRVIAISSQAVDAGPDQEMRSGFLGRAEKLVDIALAIADVDASSRVTEKLRGLLDILQPPDAFLLLDWNARRIDLLLERGGPFELFCTTRRFRALKKHL